MRKFLKRALLVIGAVVVVAGIVCVSVGGVKVSNLAAQAAQGSSAVMFVMVAAACALVGGLLLGIGLGTPSHGFKEQYAIKQAETAAKASASDAQ